MPGRSLAKPVAGSVAGLEGNGLPSNMSMSTIWNASGECFGVSVGHAGRLQERALSLFL